MDRSEETKSRNVKEYRGLIIPLIFFFFIIFIYMLPKAQAAQDEYVKALSCLTVNQKQCSHWVKILEKNSEYRVLMGAADYFHLKEIIKSHGKGQAIHGGRRVTISTESSEGAREFDEITRLYNETSNKRIFAERIKEKIRKYPYLAHINQKKSKPTVDQVISAFKIVVGDSGKEVADRFFTVMKEKSLKKYSQQYFDIKSLTVCLEKENCGILGELKQVYQEYRIYVALLNYDDLMMRVKQVGKAYIPHNGTNLIYSTRNEKGRKEIEYIVAKHNELYTVLVPRFGEDVAQEITGKKEPQDKETFQLKKQMMEGQVTFYRAMIQRYSIQYPLILNMRVQNPQRSDFFKASSRLEKKYKKMIEGIEELKGDERFELVGFVEVLEEAAEEFNELENQLISAYMFKKQNDITLLNKIKSILTNIKVIALASCHVITYFANIPHPLIQLGRLVVGGLCSAIGVGLTAKHLFKATEDLIRQIRYTVTNEYSEELLNDFVKNYLTTLIMATLYIGPGLKGLWGRSKSIGHFSRVSMRQYRKNNLWKHNLAKLVKARRNASRDVNGLAKSYGEYYGEEIIIEQILTSGGRMLVSFARFEKAVEAAMRASFGKRLQVLTYGSLMQAVP